MTTTNWRYCPQCARELAAILVQEDGGPKERLRCAACGFTHWNNPTPVLAAVVECADREGRVLLARNAAVRIIGAQPAEGSRIPGIRKWPEAYQPKIYEPERVDELVPVSQDQAEETARQLARTEGLFAGISSAGACWVALQVASQVENATIVFVVCDRGDRYLSTGVFPA